LELTSEDEWNPHQVCFLQASGDTPGGFKDLKVIYGSSTPRSVKDALKLDDVTGSDCLKKAVERSC